jgi:tetratricopeptide (TPR) repeat protein
MSKNETLKGLDVEQITEDGFEAFKKSKENDTKGRYEDDVDGYCRQKKAMLYNAGIQMFQAEKYEEAAAGFIGSTMFSEVLGVTDSAAYFNGGLAAYNAEKWEVAEEAFTKCSEIGYRLPSSISYLTEAYKNQEKFEAGEAKFAELLKMHPGDKDIMVGLINLYLPQGKKDEAEKVLTDAIAIDPENKELHYVVGTVYEGQERYDDAEKAYKKVLELDPNYTDALLGLGAVYFNKSADFNNTINELQPGDPKEDEYKNGMSENFKNSLPYLEKADELNPNNKEILNSLKQAYYKLGMTDKFKETKAKIDAL